MKKDNKKRPPFRDPAINRSLYFPYYTENMLVAPQSFDPLGSYTGVPEDMYETPVQDADDL